MQLTDLITKEEKLGIVQYITQVFKNQVPRDFNEDVSFEQVFKEYNKNKKKMFRVLGKQMRRSFDITIEKNRNKLQRDLQTLYVSPRHYSTISFFVCFVRNQAQFTGHTHNAYLSKIFMFIRKKIYEYYNIDEMDVINLFDYFGSDHYNAVHLFEYYACDHIPNMRKALIEFKDCLSIFRHCHIMAGQLVSDFQGIESLNIKGFKRGMKPMKAIRKILASNGFTDWDTFEKFRNSVSDLNITQKDKVKITLSCHPADLLTLSDNANDWHSCYSLLNEGAYSVSPLEMLNSNNVIVAYVESKNEFMNGMIPSKSWRNLIYITKDLIVTGKAYPYFWPELNQAILNIVTQLVKENFNWTYTYKNQNYNDTVFMNDSYKEDSTTENFDQFDVINKKIVLLTDVAYNDLIYAASINDYFCNRNAPKSGKTISVSGPKTCLVCGDRLERYAYHKKIHMCSACENQVMLEQLEKEDE